MVQSEKIVEMFKSDLESYEQQLKDLQSGNPQTHPSHFSEMYNLSILSRYLKDKFDTISYIEQLKKDGIWEK